MDKQGRILIVDASEKWREELTEILQHDAFYVDSVPTFDKALRQLGEALYHLLILSICLDETDPNNSDGLNLLRALDEGGLHEAKNVIILSANADKEQVRLAFRNYGVIDFLFKEEFNDEMFLENVQRAFAQSVNINLALNVLWQGIRGTEHLVSYLEIQGIHAKRDLSLCRRLSIELDDLLSRLFLRTNSILARPLVLRKNSTGVLWIQPFYLQGAGRVVVVKYGDFLKIEREYSNFKKYVEPFIGSGRSIAILNMRRTPHLGGITYSFLGATNEPLEDFGSFYRHTDVSEIKILLDRLFLHTCGAWYTNMDPLQPYNLSDDYRQSLRLTLEKLEKALWELRKTVQGKQKILFKDLGGQSFTNPLLAMDGPALWCSTYACITHGDLNEHNLLVDTTGYPWLIDFQETGRGYLLRDIAQLDSTIRFRLLDSEEVTLEDRLQMEEVLCSIEHFSQVGQLATSFSVENQVLMKAYVTVVHLRTLASKLVEKNPNDDIREYYIALFYNAMNIVQRFRFPTRLREHALLSASILADRLKLIIEEST